MKRKEGGNTTTSTVRGPNPQRTEMSTVESTLNDVDGVDQELPDLEDVPDLVKLLHQASVPNPQDSISDLSGPLISDPVITTPILDAASGGREC